MLVRVHLQYGRDGLDVDFPRDNVTVVAPRYVPGLPDERAAFRAAIASPIASPPLVEIVGREDRVAIVIPDITPPLPTISSSLSTAPARTGPTPRRNSRQWLARRCWHATAWSITIRTIRPRWPTPESARTDSRSF